MLLKVLRTSVDYKKKSTVVVEKKMISMKKKKRNFEKVSQISFICPPDMREKSMFGEKKKSHIIIIMFFLIMGKVK